jgi:hypothetical protein
MLMLIKWHTYRQPVALPFCQSKATWSRTPLCDFLPLLYYFSSPAHQSPAFMDSTCSEDADTALDRHNIHHHAYAFALQCAPILAHAHTWPTGSESPTTRNSFTCTRMSSNFIKSSTTHGHYPCTHCLSLSAVNF